MNDATTTIHAFEDVLVESDVAVASDHDTAFGLSLEFVNGRPLAILQVGGDCRADADLDDLNFVAMGGKVEQPHAVEHHRLGVLDQA